MASIEKRVRDGRIRYYVRYRTPAGQQRSKTFDRKRDASEFLVTVEGSKLVGGFVDPRRAKISVGEWVGQWLAAQADLSPSTRYRYQGIVREHIVPRWGSVSLADVGHADVQAWVAGIDLAPASVRKIHRVLSMALDWAVKDGRIARNPAAGVSLPRPRHAEKRFLTHVQVDALAAACGPWGLVVRFLAYTGLRWGEMAALRVSRLDLLRRRAIVVESVTPVNGLMTWGAPKTHERREVPLPRFLCRELEAHIVGKGPDDLVFSGWRGAVMRTTTFRRQAFTAAATELGLTGLHPHELRHTAASLAIASGADVKVVQQMLGHKSATMTLDQYGHLFADRLDVVAEALDAARDVELARVYPMCTAAALDTSRKGA